jgi:hypothetical protein
VVTKKGIMRVVDPTSNAKKADWSGLQFAYFVFRGWDDADLAQRYGLPGIYDEEIRARRVGPAHPPGIIEIESIGGTKTDALGSMIEVLFDPNHADLTTVRSYLTEGLRLRIRDAGPEEIAEANEGRVRGVFTIPFLVLDFRKLIDSLRSWLTKNRPGK